MAMCSLGRHDCGWWRLLMAAMVCGCIAAIPSSRGRRAIHMVAHLRPLHIDVFVRSRYAARTQTRANHTQLRLPGCAAVHRELFYAWHVAGKRMRTKYDSIGGGSSGGRGSESAAIRLRYDTIVVNTRTIITRQLFAVYTQYGAHLERETGDADAGRSGSSATKPPTVRSFVRSSVRSLRCDYVSTCIFI